MAMPNETTRGGGWNTGVANIRKLLNIGKGVMGGPGVYSCVSKTITGIADATATTVLTVTVPNSAHAAMIDVDVIGILGAGGAVGADEAARVVKYQLTVVRTAGVAAVVAVSSAIGGAAANVAGATTVASVVVTATAMTGANSATQTFNIQVNITKTGGASTNHVALISASVLNHNVSGVTMA